MEKNEEMLTKQEIETLRQNIANIWNQIERFDLYSDRDKLILTNKLNCLNYMTEFAIYYITKESMERIKKEKIMDIISKLEENIIDYKKTTLDNMTEFAIYYIAKKNMEKNRKEKTKNIISELEENIINYKQTTKKIIEQLKQL